MDTVKNNDPRKDLVEETITEMDAIGTSLATYPCISEKPSSPCTIVIIGASGDLTARKLIPSLYKLFLNNSLPESFVIIGCARTALDHLSFRNRMLDGVKLSNNINSDAWQNFSSRMYYQKLIYDEPSSFKNLSNLLIKLEKRHGTRGNRIFYFAIPPFLYKTTAKMLGQAGLSTEYESGKGWVRIVVEKPFGSDLQTAVDLDQTLRENFKEHQIYRIDHYLAKETVQNILVFRFANVIFEPLWNRNFISHIHITAAETLGVEHRAGYYEKAGVLRDMFQSHMMQLLALTAMEPPSHFEADLVRNEKCKVFRSLRPFPLHNIEQNLILGQYGPGIIDGKSVPGYREESGVNPESMTPTFAAMSVFIDNWRWQGVPFYLVSGKRLAKKLTEIVIQFKEVPYSVFRQIIGKQITANRLTFSIQPQEKITLTFQTKNPGASICLRSVNMNFGYHQNYIGPILDAYEKVLLDCMLGDQMLFWREDGIELSWSFLTPILEYCESCSKRSSYLHLYKAGDWGPSGTEKLNTSFDQMAGK